MMDTRMRTFFCGDLVPQPASGEQASTDADILGPSEASRRQMDDSAHSPDTAALLAGLAEQQPNTLACMHGSAWQGDGAALLRQLSRLLADDAR